MYEYNAIVKRVISGDQFEATVDLGFGATIRRVFKIRGVEAPSIFKPKDEKERQAAMNAKDFLNGLLYLKRVKLETSKVGNFGKYDAKIFLQNGEDVASVLKGSGYY